MSILDIFKKKQQQETEQKITSAKKTSSITDKKSEETGAGVVQEKTVPAETATTKNTKKVEKKTSPSVKIKNTKDAYRILVAPILTEKSTRGNTDHQYTFRVAKEANKIQVKEAIASVYGVKPVAVNMVKYGARDIRFGTQEGKTKQWKKAIVTLRKGDKLNEKI